MKFPLALTKPVVLASGSPRRPELLRKLGIDFRVHPSDIDEGKVSGLPPAEIVCELARRKAWSVAELYDEGLIIGVDTIVVLGNKVLGKPASADEAREMLAELSGRTHEVFTGCAIVDRPEGRTKVEAERTAVTFRPLHASEIAAYVESGAALDKAGAYGIQDFSAVFVERIDGCFYNVVGFPLTRFYLMLRDFCAVSQ